MEARLREIIRTIVKEIQSEKELEEMTGTGAVAGYDTPAAFSKPGQTKKKNNRLASVTGGTVVDDLEEGITSSAGAPFSKPSDVAGKNAKLAKISGGTIVGEGEKDWALGDIPASSDEAFPMKPTAAKKNDLGSQRLFQADSMIGVKIIVSEISSPALVAEVILRPKVSTLIIADWVSPKIVPRTRSVLENFFLLISQMATMARVAIAKRTESIAGTVA